MAAYAAVLIVEDFRLEGLALGIGAPRAAQRAALEKDYRTYAGTVVRGKALNVEDYCHRNEHYQVIFVWSIFNSVRKNYKSSNNSAKYVAHGKKPLTEENHRFYIRPM
ncbi:MAG: hypothetical protein ACLQDL_00830 [Spirochaetia bacterium]